VIKISFLASLVYVKEVSKSNNECEHFCMRPICRGWGHKGWEHFFILFNL